MERVILAGLAFLLASAQQEPKDPKVPIGVLPGARRVSRLHITQPGTYENYLVDADGSEETAVTIRADNVVLRHCEIRNGRGEGIDVHGKDVTIEHVKIHHLLKGTYKKPVDAHGISGTPRGLTIRNCEIFYCSGDGIQFDPGRGAWDDVLIENCRIWTGPLPQDALGWKKGQRPGENALDTKTPKDETARLTIRSSVFQGFRQPAQLDNMAALNLKEKVRVRVENCTFEGNEISLRIRGSGATVDVKGCTVARSDIALRVEDEPRVSVEQLTIGEDVGRRIEYAGKNSARCVEK